ncbi:MAG: tripartite tricarboxylate transporter TctB family protein [Kiritimatiellae bacterium]|nr:tripartite tricarboxylate transporter TctB family protein [Kiritimatiellia bacterium]
MKPAFAVQPEPDPALHVARPRDACRRRLRLLAAGAAALASACWAYAGVPGRSAFPRKPVTVIVYTGPGGLIDITARKFTETAARHTDAVFVVENKPGAGGLVAMQRLLELPADGHTLYACTKSNIAKLVETRRETYIAAIDWVAMLMADPECVITRRAGAVNTWERLLDDARAARGGQIWVGPAAGGLDHVMAMKVWDRCGFSAKWIPFTSGGMAIAALLGEQGAAYVGNPGDTLGQPALKVVAVSGAARLPSFPDAPTFRELGVQGLDEEFMWRGFALKRGTPADILKWYHALFAAVTRDPDWRAFWAKSGIEAVYHDAARFTQIVEQDRADFALYLGRIGAGGPAAPRGGLLARWARGAGPAVLLAVFVLLNAGIAIWLRFGGGPQRLGRAVVPLLLLSISAVFAFSTAAFPAHDRVGPAVVPRLWIGVLVPVSLGLLVQALRGRPVRAAREVRPRLAPAFAGLLCLYLAGLYLVGYFVSSFLALPAAMRLLGYRRWRIMAAVSAAWLCGAYLVFYRLLHVPLPVGRLVEKVLAATQ